MKLLMLLRLVLLVLVLLPAAAGAQSLIPSPPTEATAAAVEPDVSALIETLENPESRDALIAKLKALAKTEGAPEEPEAAALVDQLADEITERQQVLSDVFIEVGQSWRRLPDLGRWVRNELADPYRRWVWLETSLWLTLIVSLGVVARGVVQRLWGLVGIGTQPTKLVALRRFARAVIAAVAFVLTVMIVLRVSDPPWLAQLSGMDLTLGLAGCFVVLPLLDLLFAADPRLRLLPVSDAIANPLRAGLKRALPLGILGYFILSAARQVGLPWTLHGFLSHLVFLVVAAILIVTILRLRSPVAEAIRSLDRKGGMITRFVPWSIVAAGWHVVAVLFVAMHFLVWALNVPGGLTYLSRSSVLSVLVLVGARLLAFATDRLLAGKPEPVDEAEAPPPSTRMLAPLRLLARFLIIVFAVVLLLKIWDIGLLDWIDARTGTSLMAFLGEIAAILIVVVGLAQIATTLFNRHIEAVDAEDQPIHSNRSRTFASILKNVVIVLLIGIALLVILARLGVNTGALLAGAGVIGLAIGFGSQKLVQDLITGLFILLGDIARVGDVVEVGGRIGVIEAISMRTMQLRGYDGNVHIVPYSSIDIVTNYTKDYSFTLLDIPVSYREDADTVMEILREIDVQLRKEWPFRRLILAPLEIAGLDQFQPSAMVIRARSKVRPGEQWTVKREFYRRIKLAFEAQGIEIPLPHMRLWFGEDKDGRAPPLRVEQEARELRALEDDKRARETGDKPKGAVA